MIHYVWFHSDLTDIKLLNHVSSRWWNNNYVVKDETVETVTINAAECVLNNKTLHRPEGIPRVFIFPVLANLYRVSYLENFWKKKSKNVLEILHHYWVTLTVFISRDGQILDPVIWVLPCCKFWLGDISCDVRVYTFQFLSCFIECELPSLASVWYHC